MHADALAYGNVYTLIIGCLAESSLQTKIENRTEWYHSAMSSLSNLRKKFSSSELEALGNVTIGEYRQFLILSIVAENLSHVRYYMTDCYLLYDLLRIV